METQEIQRLDFETFRPKLGGWADKFKPFIESKEMWDIYQRIREDAKHEEICPESKDTFRAFSTTNPKDVKVIFYLMDPYSRKYKDSSFQATGIAMDCSNSKKGTLQPSLEKWYDAMDKELGHKVNRSPNLEYLHQQGIMLLNTDLTCKLNKTQSHEGLWAPFQKYFLEEVMYGTTGIVYVLCGKASHKMKRFINPLGNYIIEVEHPAYAARMRTDWDCKSIFSTIRRILYDNNGYQIFWDKTEWIDFQTPPF